MKGLESWIAGNSAMYASVAIILISGNSQSRLLGNAEVKNLNVGFNFLMKILPYKKKCDDLP